MDKPIYEVPMSLKEIFENKAQNYKIIDYSKGFEMDNVQALDYLLEYMGIPAQNIELQEGTEAILIAPNYSYLIHISSSGLGDFFSHLFEVTLLKKDSEGNYQPYEE